VGKWSWWTWLSGGQCVCQEENASPPLQRPLPFHVCIARGI